MKIKTRMLRIKSHHRPFETLNDVDKENTKYIIDSGDFLDEPLSEETQIPKYLELICELKPIKEFNPSIRVSATYDKMQNQSPSSTKTLLKNLYDGSSANMGVCISAIDLIYKDILPNEIIIPESWYQYLSENSKIYTKSFLTQKNNFQVKMTEDPRYNVSIFSHLLSNAYPFAGTFYRGIDINDIEQQFFYVGTGEEAKEYLQTISLKNLLKNTIVKFFPGIEFSKITSFQDEISMGNLKINMPGDISYQSINIKKNTVLSNLCVITFRRIEK